MSTRGNRRGCGSVSTSCSSGTADSFPRGPQGLAGGGERHVRDGVGPAPAEAQAPVSTGASTSMRSGTVVVCQPTARRAAASARVCTGRSVSRTAGPPRSATARAKRGQHGGRRRRTGPWARAATASAVAASARGGRPCAAAPARRRARRAVAGRWAAPSRGRGGSRARSRAAGRRGRRTPGRRTPCAGQPCRPPAVPTPLPSSGGPRPSGGRGGGSAARRDRSGQSEDWRRRVPGMFRVGSRQLVDDDGGGPRVGVQVIHAEHDRGPVGAADHGGQEGRVAERRAPSAELGDQVLAGRRDRPGDEVRRRAARRGCGGLVPHQADATALVRRPADRLDLEPGMPGHEVAEGRLQRVDVDRAVDVERGGDPHARLAARRPRADGCAGCRSSAPVRRSRPAPGGTSQVTSRPGAGSQRSAETTRTGRLQALVPGLVGRRGPPTPAPPTAASNVAVSSAMYRSTAACAAGVSGVCMTRYSRSWSRFTHRDALAVRPSPVKCRPWS